MRLPLLLVLSIAAVPGAAAQRDDRVPAATDTGKPLSCLPISRIRQSLVRSDQVIDFIGPGRQVYRNTLPYRCPGLGFEQRFLYETSLSQLCSTDIITVLYQTGPTRGASCGLGRFQPVTLARRSDAR